jgi:hypothetical protein
MTKFTRHNLPVEIAVFAGDFASQQLAFAHLMDAAPTLDLAHVDVIQRRDPTTRLAQYFPDPVVRALMAVSTGHDTLVLILPAAFRGLTCPLTETALLWPLGEQRGIITRMIATQAMPE